MELYCVAIMAHPERRHKISMEEGIRFQGGPQQRYCPFITKESSDQQFHNAGMNFPHTWRGISCYIFLAETSTWEKIKSDLQ